MNRIGLAEFLTDLRAELAEAQSRATQDSLKLAVEEIVLTMNVAYTLTKGGESSASVRAKFWVLELGEAGAKASASSQRANTQQLTLTLKPQVEQVTVDGRGRPTTIRKGVDVEGSFAPGEQRAPIPRLPGRS